MQPATVAIIVTLSLMKFAPSQGACEEGKTRLIAFPRVPTSRFLIGLAAALVIAFGLWRYLQAPSFWLDEAYIAAQLKQPSFHAIFARLEYGQYFPRLYLLALAGLRELLGYEIWVLRLLPFLLFIAGTLLWAYLLQKRTGAQILPALIAGGLLIGSGYWLDQAIQLKQYTFDVALALVPFAVSDAVLQRAFVEGKERTRLALFALPSLLSYTYPLAFGARLLGWYLEHGRLRGWKVRLSAVGLVATVTLMALAAIWLTDHRFNLQDKASYFSYWRDCILSSSLPHGAGATLRLLAKFLWGWHGRMPPVTAGMIGLQAIGIFAIAQRWKRRAAEETLWGSRSMGALVLLVGMVAASLLVHYPICAGRAMLFTQLQTQVLALEGAIWLLQNVRRAKLVNGLLWAFVAVLLFYSGRQFVRTAATEPDENLLPAVALIDRNQADSIWVHPCSVAQVRSLPDGLPVDRVIVDTKNRLPERGQRMWVVWTHLGSEDCQKQLADLRQRARSWQLIHEGAGRGLALAEF